MKRAFFKYFNLLMACIVLLSSTGFGLIEHTCLMRGKKVSMAMNRQAQQNCQIHGKSEVSITSQSSAGPIIKKADCCQEEQWYENVEFSSSITQLVAKFIKSMTNLVLTGVATFIGWLLNELFSVDTSLLTTGIDSPPLPYGRSLLSFVQSFLL